MKEIRSNPKMQGKHFPVPISWHGFILILACLDLVSSGEVSWMGNCSS